MSNKDQKVAIALSGGVDSGLSAALLVKTGYKVAGFHMHLWSEEGGKKVVEKKNLAYGENLVDSGRAFVNKCCSTESLEAAKKTCHKLNIPFYIVDLEKVFKKKVVDYFLAEYAQGRTPNPCVVCNKLVKFGALFDYTKMLGYEYLATGHYARVIREASGNFDSVSDSLANNRLASNKVSGARKVKPHKISLAPHPRFYLVTAVDESKDQSYFLYSLTQKQLAQVMFPVGNYTKKEVRQMAKKWRLPVARRPESQEICFFPETDYRPFLRRQIAEKLVPGEVVDTKGRVIGRHSGLPLYTIGQRHGFAIHNSAFSIQHSDLIPPYYVIDKNLKKNRLIVGFGKETEEKEFEVEDVNWIQGNCELSNYQIANCFVRIRHQGEMMNCELSNFQIANCLVRIRHQGELLNCELSNYQIANYAKKIRVILNEPQRGIAPGQAAVLYRLLPPTSCLLSPVYEVLGGGIIK